MYQDDFYNPADPNDFDNDNNGDKTFEKAKRMDKGYNVIYRKALRKDGRSYNKKIELYTSSSTGCRIRDAETGSYLPSLVGSKDEDLYFKVSLATGECTSANGSTTLFYSSPQHYANHLMCEVDPQIALKWEDKKNARLAELKREKRDNANSVVEVK
jgi:hypothetical protein